MKKKVWMAGEKIGKEEGKKRERREKMKVKDDDVSYGINALLTHSQPVSQITTK